MNFGNKPTIRNSLIINPAAGDIGSPVDGEIWYNSSTGKFRKRENGTTTDLDTGGGGAITVNTGTTGTDFNISGSPVSLGGTITLNIPDASASNRGLVTTGTQTIAGTKTFTGGITLNGSPISTSNGTFRFSTSSSSSSETILGVGSTNLQYWHALTNNGSTLSANDSFAAFYINAGTAGNATIEASSGTHALVSNVFIKPLTLNNGTATTTNGATLYIEGAATGTATITNNYSLWVDAGNVRLDGKLWLGTTNSSSSSLLHAVGDITASNSATWNPEESAGVPGVLLKSSNGEIVMRNTNNPVWLSTGNGGFLRVGQSSGAQDGALYAAEIGDTSAAAAGNVFLFGSQTWSVQSTGGMKVTSRNYGDIAFFSTGASALPGGGNSWINGGINIGTNTASVASAVLEVTSTTRGFLPPRMTSTQRTSIGTPATALMVYQTDSTENLYIKKSSAWKRILTEDDSIGTGQSAIQFQDEGVNQGTSGGITSVNFVGSGVTASASGAALTVTINGGGAAAGSNGEIQFNNSGSFGGSSNFFWDNTNFRIGLRTSAPTHTMTLASTADGIAYYKTADQTTNYERGVIKWVSNEFKIITEKGGTGSDRIVSLDSSTLFFRINGNLRFSIDNNTTLFNPIYTQDVPSVAIGGGSSNSDGNAIAFAIYNQTLQSGTAGYKGIWVTPYFNTTGSGEKLLIDIGTNTAINAGGTHTSHFSVSSTGVVKMNSIANTTSSNVLYYNTTTKEVSYGAAPSGGGTTITPSQLTADQDNYSPTGWDDAETVRVSSDATFRAITSMAAPTTSSKPQTKKIINVGSNPIYFPGEHPDGTAANRINFSADFLLYPKQVIEMYYDTTASRWVPIGENNIWVRKGVSYSYSAGSITAADVGDIAWAQTGTAAATTAIASTTARPASNQMATGSTATGLASAYFAKSVNTYGAFGSSHMYAEALLSIPTLSDGTETFTVYLLITNSPNGTTAEPNNSVFIRYSHGVNGGRWQLVSQDNAGAESVADLGVTVAANTLYQLRIEIDKGRSEVRAYVDGVMSGRVTGNMPNAVVAGAKVTIAKTVGSTSRNLYMHSFSAGAIW